MANQASRTQLLRECGIVESGVDEAFQRIARIGAGVARAKACLITFGYESQILVKGHWAIGPADELRLPPDLYEQLIAEGGPPALWANDVAGAVIRAPEGTKVGIVCVGSVGLRNRQELLDVLVDIAALAQSELALRRARQPDERTTKILENMTDAWVFLDNDWRYTYVNKKAGEILDRDPAELVGKHIWTEFPEGIGHPFHRAYEAAAADHLPKRIEEFYPPYNRWFENRIYPGPDGIAIFFQDVTERRRAEDERRRLASIIENTTDIVAITNAEGGLLFLNRSARAVLGIADDVNVRELHILRMHAVGSRERLCDALAHATRHGCWRGEATLLHTSGIRVAASEVILWHPGQPPADGYFSLVARDITEQKRAEDERRKNAELRAQTERMAHLGYWTWDIVPNRISWSDELYRIFGVEPGSIEVSFESYLARIHPEERERVRETIQATLRDRTACTFEDTIVRPNGELRYLHSWASVDRDDGQPRQMFGICLDATDLRRTIDDLQHTREWLEAALTNTHIAVWEWDMHTNALRFSAGAAEALGHDGLASTFDEYLRHLHPDDAPMVMESFRAALDRGRVVDLEHRVRAADGSTRWLVVRCRPPRPAGKPVERLLGTVVDVTERHLAEDDRRTLLQRLMDAQKMEAIGRLAAGVAHDFNNHLTVIQSAAELLARGAALAGPLRQLATDIEEAADNAAKLTRQLLTFGRQKQQLDIRPLNLNELIRNTSKLLRHLIPDNVELELDLDAGLGPVLSDAEQLERVLLNLVVNARDAMPEGGRITVVTRVEPRYAVLEVQDHGVGMSSEIKERIFEPFFTTKAGGSGSGLGLGLATVYGIVTQSGGSIDVDSEPGVGTAFRVRLPLADTVS